MKSIEAYFLACHYQAEYPQKVIAAIRVVLHQENRSKSHIELSDFLVRKILFENRPSYCLFNLIVGMNMARLRKHVRLEDLVHFEPGGVINTFDYDGSAKVKERIAVYVNDQVHAWRSLSRERAEIEKVNYYLKPYTRADEKGYRSYDFKPIGEFYDLRRESEPFHFSRDRENAAHTAANFFNLYLSDLENFLTGTVELESYGPTSVFKPDFFQFETDQLRRFSQKLAESVYSCPCLSMEEFGSFKKLDREKNPSSAQVAVIQAVDALADTVVDIGRKTGAVCQRQDRSLTWSAEDKAVPQPLELSSLRLSSISSPLFRKTVLSKGYLKDRSVIDSLSAITALSFLAGLYFHNQKLTAVLNREFRIGEGIREAKKNLERIADAVTYEKIRLLDDISGD